MSIGSDNNNIAANNDLFLNRSIPSDVSFKGQPAVISTSLSKSLVNPKKPWEIGQQVLNRMQPAPKSHLFKTYTVQPSDPEYDDVDQLVVFQRSQTLTRFWIKLAVDMPRDIGHYNFFESCYEACRSGLLPRIKAFVQENISLLQGENEEGETLLYAAVLGNQLEVLQWLYAQNPSLLKKCRKDGWNLMHVAAAEGHAPIVQWLQKQETNLLQELSPEKWTPLHCAVFNEQLSVLGLFVDFIKKEINLLEQLVERPCSKTLDFLLNQGLDPETSNRFKQSLLHLAAQAGQEENVRCLLQYKAQINAQDLSGRTALFLAVTQGHRSIVQFLLKKGADSTILTCGNESVLHIAAFYGHTPIMQDLLKESKAKLLIKIQDSDGKIPLHSALWGDSKQDVVQLLLDQGSDPNAINSFSYTPLHWACKNGHTQSFNLLIKRGARLDIVNANHDLPLDLAIRWGKDDIFHLLMGTIQRLSMEKVPEDIEGHFFKCLIEAKKNKLFEEQIIYLLRLGDFYIQREDFLKGAKLFNGALAVLQKHKNHSLIEEYLFNRLTQLEAKFLKSLGLKRPETKNLSFAYRHELKRVREIAGEAHAKKKDIQLILANLTEEYMEMLGCLIADAQVLLGPSPVKWACIGLGSMSRGEMCPNSDLEFAFLLEKATDDAFKYFRTLSQILELRIINLGETRFPIFSMVDPLHPSPTPGGFSLDTGGNTPLGVSGVYELIGTPRKLAQFEEIQWINRNIILPNAMNTVCWILGDKTLVDQYNKEKIIILDKKSSKNKKTNREELAFSLLKGNLEEFRPNLTKEKEEIKAFGIKKELYRPFQEGMSCLAIYYNLKEKNTFSRIDELLDLKVISAKGAVNLKAAFKCVLSLRFEAHQFYQDEQEYLCHPEEGKEHDSSLLYMNEKHIEALHAIYRVLLPFHKTMEKFFHTKNKKALNSNNFYDEGPVVQGEVFEKTLQYYNAKESYQQAVALNPDDEDAISQLSLMNNQLGERNEALKRCQQALNIAIQKYGKEHENVAYHYNSMGHIYFSLGQNIEAMKAHQKALSLLLRYYDEEYPAIALFYNNIGTIHDALGHRKEALDCYEKALKTLLMVYGEEHQDVARVYSSISLDYLYCGRHQDAMEYGQKALRIRLKVFGEVHPQVAVSYQNIGGCYQSCGQIQEALNFYQKALKVHHKIYGEEHPNMVTMYQLIGVNHLSMGNFQEALKYSQHALVLCQKFQDNDQPFLYNNIGLIYQSLGYYHEAMKYFEKALAIWVDAYDGEEHHNVATCYNNIGVANNFLGQYQKALDFHLKAFKIWTHLYGEEQNDIARSYYHMGKVFHSMNKTELSMEHLQKSLKIRLKLYKEDHPELVACYVNFGQILQSVKYEESLEFYQKALKIRLKSLGESNPLLNEIYNNIGLVLQSLGLHKEAWGYHQKVVKICHVAYSNPHPDLAQSYRGMGLILNHRGEFAKALEYFEQAFIILLNVYKDNHPSLQEIFHDLTSVQDSKVSEVLKSLHMKCEDILGENHQLSQKILQRSL